MLLLKLPQPRFLPFAILAALLASRVAAQTALDSAPVLACQIVLDWNEAFLSPVREQSPPPVVVARNLAVLHLAMHEAYGVPSGEDENNAAAARAASAARDVCAAFFPSRLREFDQLWQEQTARLAAGERSAALEAGMASARRWLHIRSGDGAGATAHYLPRSEPGQWRRTAPAMRPPELPRWFEVAPFLLDAADQFRPAAPPALDSVAYGEALDEVRTLGAIDSAIRTAEQTEVAHFWSDFSYTSTPPGHWNAIARTLVRERLLSARDTARLFAVLNVAMADAGIACWDTKYAYNFWRPETAIHRADEDGHDATSPDAGWQPLLAAPPHPEYVSGHAAFSGAAITVLAALVGGDPVAFTTESDALPGVTRHFSSLEACAEEICASRVYGGIHFGFSGKAGCELGRKVGAWVLEMYGGRTESLPPSLMRVPVPWSEDASRSTLSTERVTRADSLTSRLP